MTTTRDTTTDPKRVIMMSMNEVRAKVDGLTHWFEPSTMRFFRSRLPQWGYHGKRKQGLVYFASSEQFDENTPRLYTVRCINLSTGKVETIGAFQQHATRQKADDAAYKEALKN